MGISALGTISDGDGPLLINAAPCEPWRIAAFGAGGPQRRCLIPADGFMNGDNGRECGSVAVVYRRRDLEAMVMAGGLWQDCGTRRRGSDRVPLSQPQPAGYRRIPRMPLILIPTDGPCGWAKRAHGAATLMPPGRLTVKARVRGSIRR